MLPGHRFLLDGRGYEAVLLTVIGGLGVSLLTMLTIPMLVYVLPALYLLIRPVLHLLLLAVFAWMVYTEPGYRKLPALIIFTMAGAFGVVSLNAFPSGISLFPAITGMFALSTLLVSYSADFSIPRQTRTGEIEGDHRRGILTGWLAGWFAGMLPGVGAAQAGVLAAHSVRAGMRDFLTALGGINTSNILFTFIVFYTIGKTRSGATWAASQMTGSIGSWEMALLIMIGITTCFISALTTIGLARVLLGRIRNINYRTINLAVIALLITMAAVLSGPAGLLILATGTMIGLLAIYSGVRRSHLMGYLMLPTILYLSGIHPAAMLTLGIW